MDLKRIFKFKLKQIVGIRVCYAWGLVWYGLAHGLRVLSLSNQNRDDTQKNKIRVKKREPSMDTMFSFTF